MNYELIFDAGEAGYTTWPFAVVGVLFVVIGVLVVRHRRSLPTRFHRGMSPQGVSVFAYAFLGFALVWTTGAFATTCFDYVSLRSAIRGGQAEVVEGRVDNFSPMPFSGHAMEHFTVCGVPFSYSDYVVTAGFNQTRSHGGPIREGLWVRIAYSGNDIGRLEVATDDPGEAAQCHRSGGLTGQ
jgi:hypothetical protein